MANEVIGFTLEANAQNLLDELGKIDGVSRKEARAMVANIKRASAQAAKASKSAAETSRKAWAKSTSSNVEGFRKMSSVVQGDIGRVMSAVLDAGESLAAFGKVLGPAGAVGLGLVAAAAGFAVIGAAAVKATHSMASFAAATADVLDDAEKLARIESITPVDPAQVEALRRFQSAFDDVGRSVEAVTFQIGVMSASDFAPLMEVFAAGGRDVAGVIKTMSNAFQTANESAGGLTMSLSDLLVLTGDLSQKSVDATRNARARAIAQDVVKASLEGVEKVDGRRAELTKLLNGLVTESVELADKRIKQLDEEQAKTDASNAKAQAAIDIATAATKAQQATINSALRGRAKSAQIFNDEIADINRREGLNKDAAQAEDARDAARVKRSERDAKIDADDLAQKKSIHDAKTAMANEELARAEERAEVFKEIDRQVADERAMIAQAQIDSGFAVANASASIAKTIADSAKEGTQAQKNAAMAAFVIAKATSIAQIAVNTGAGISRQFADFPYPVALPNSIAVAATGAASLAVAASEPAPSFHLGGTPAGSGAANQPGVTQATILDNEEVRTVQQQREGGGMVIQANLMVGHRTTDRMMTDTLRDRNSPLSKQFRKGRNTGKGSYRNG